MGVGIATSLTLMHFLLSIVSEAHSWIDCFDTKRSTVYDESVSYIYGADSGNGKCQGYGEYYPGRGNIDIGMGYTHKMLKNEVEAGTPVCKSADGGDAYLDWRKRLSLAPGQEAFFGYMPNGHIAKDKKAIGTQYGIYWTAQVGTSLTSTLDMKPEHLLNGHTVNFDDGNCGESVDYNGNPSGRAGDGKPCVGTFTIPAGTAPGIYNLVWYWTFWLDNETSYVDQAQAKGYFGAAYSTCFEVEVISDGSNTIKDEIAPASVPADATPAPIAPTESLASNPIAEAAAPTLLKPAAGATLDFEDIAPKSVNDSDDDDATPLKNSLKGVATVHGARQSSSNWRYSSAASDRTTNGDDLDVRQEEPPTSSTTTVSAPSSTAVSTPSSTSDTSSKSRSSTLKQGSFANYVKTSEGWLLLGIALLLGALV